MRKEKAPSLGEGTGRQGGTQSRVTNGQTSIHQVAIKTNSEKEAVRYVQFIRRLGMRWEGKRAWVKASGGWFHLFMGFYFFTYFYVLRLTLCFKLQRRRKGYFCFSCRD